MLCCYVMRCCSLLLAVVSCGESRHPGVFAVAVAVAGAVGRGSGP